MVANPDAADAQSG